LGVFVSFFTKLSRAVTENNSLLCVGLDSDPAKIPGGIAIADFNRAIIEATAEFACAYKINLAFYEAEGEAGMAALRATLERIPENIPVIGDAKRADIGNTSTAYARAIFDDLGFDAITVNPYLGHDALQPFLDYKEKGIFILCRTSNPGAGDFQTLSCITERGNMPLYRIVADKAAAWNTNGNIGLVVGATNPGELKLIREHHPGMPLLIPGIGAQGGDLELTVKNGQDNGGAGILINSSRQIIFASSGDDYAVAAGKAAREMRKQINRYRSAV
jgi:orotidine-5'-phosphate decarboxylase